MNTIIVRARAYNDCVSGAQMDPISPLDDPLHTSFPTVRPQDQPYPSSHRILIACVCYVVQQTSTIIVSNIDLHNSHPGSVQDMCTSANTVPLNTHPGLVVTCAKHVAVVNVTGIMAEMTRNGPLGSPLIPQRYGCSYTHRVMYTYICTHDAARCWIRVGVC